MKPNPWQPMHHNTLHTNTCTHTHNLKHALCDTCSHCKTHTMVGIIEATTIPPSPIQVYYKTRMYTSTAFIHSIPQCIALLRVASLISVHSVNRMRMWFSFLHITLCKQHLGVCDGPKRVQELEVWALS